MKELAKMTKKELLEIIESGALVTTEVKENGVLVKGVDLFIQYGEPTKKQTEKPGKAPVQANVLLSLFMDGKKVANIQGTKVRQGRSGLWVTFPNSRYEVDGKERRYSYVDEAEGLAGGLVKYFDPKRRVKAYAYRDQRASF